MLEVGGGVSLSGVFFVMVAQLGVRPSLWVLWPRSTHGTSAVMYVKPMETNHRKRAIQRVHLHAGIKNLEETAVGAEADWE